MDWETHDAFHAIMRAHQIIGDKKLMAKVRKHAKGHSKSMAAEARRAQQLAKSGLISDKQMGALKGSKIPRSKPRGGVGRGMAGM